MKWLSCSSNMLMFHSFPMKHGGFPVVFLWFSNVPTGFPMVFPFSHRFSYGFSYAFPFFHGFSYAFPMVFPFSHGFSRSLKQWYHHVSHGFPMVFLGFFQDVETLLKGLTSRLGSAVQVESLIEVQPEGAVNFASVPGKSHFGTGKA